MVQRSPKVNGVNIVAAWLVSVTCSFMDVTITVINGDDEDLLNSSSGSGDFEGSGSFGESHLEPTTPITRPIKTDDVTNELPILYVIIPCVAVFVILLLAFAFLIYRRRTHSRRKLNASKVVLATHGTNKQGQRGNCGDNGEARLTATYTTRSPPDDINIYPDYAAPRMDRGRLEAPQPIISNGPPSTFAPPTPNEYDELEKTVENMKHFP